MRIYPTTVDELKSLSFKITAVSALLSVISVTVFLYTSFSSSPSSAGMAGLAILMIAPFIYLDSIFVLNTIIYAALLVLTKFKSPSLFIEYKFANTLCLILLATATIVALYYIISPVLLILMTLPAIVFAIFSMFYSRLTIFLARFSSQAFVIICVPLAIILLVGAIVYTYYKQNADIMEINSLAKKYGGNTLVFQEADKAQCKTKSLFVKSDSNIQNTSEYKAVYLFSRDISLKEIDPVYLSANMDGATDISVEINDKDPSDIKTIIREAANSRNVQSIMTIYPDPVVNFESLTAVSLANVYNRATDKFTDYVWVYTPSQICFLF